MSEIILSEQKKMDLGVLLYLLGRYKYSILLFFVVTVLIATTIAYFKPITYTSTITMEVADEGNNRGDALSLALGESSSNFANEREVITSRYLIEKALDQLDLGRRYFVNDNYKTIELYKNSPFIVNIKHFDRKLYGKMLYVIPIDDSRYKLEVRKESFFSKRSLKDFLNIDKSETFEYNQEFEYGQEVVSPWFTLKIEKIFSLGLRQYSFSVVPNEAMYYHVVNGLHASLTNRQGSIVAISYRDNVALRAKEIVQAIADVYMADQIEKKRKSAEQILKFIDGELEDLNVNLNESANILKTYKQTNQITDLESSAASIKERVNANEVQLSQIYLEEELLFSFQEYVKSGKDLSGIAINNTQLSNSNLITQIEKYQKLSEKNREFLASYTEFHPDVIKIKNEISIVKESIEFILETSLKNLQQRKLWIKAQNEKLLSSLQVLPQQERKLSNLTRNFSVNEKIYLYLLERRSETAILQASTISGTRIIDTPITPGPNPSKRTFIIFVGALMGLLIGCLQAYVRYLINNTITSPKDVESIVNIPFYGSIPYQSKFKYTLAYEEAYRTLRTNLEFINIDRSSKVILAASSISGEGKSTTVKNLAEMLVKLNRSVIVLDFDLRRPSLHKYFFEIENNVGLSTLLSGQSSLQESIQLTKDKISIISAGPIPPNPSELIMSESTKLLFKTLRNTYDYILVDSPPYSIVTDAAILMKEADITLFSIMSDYTNREQVKQLKNMITKYEIKFAGIVYHGLKLKKKELHGYGYYS